MIPLLLSTLRLLLLLLSQLQPLLQLFTPSNLFPGTPILSLLPGPLWAPLSATGSFIPDRTFQRAFYYHPSAVVSQPSLLAFSSVIFPKSFPLQPPCCSRGTHADPDSFRRSDSNISGVVLNLFPAEEDGALTEQPTHVDTSGMGLDRRS